jgi:pimeloyl-ACP methyl ester carboxylesterase
MSGITDSGRRVSFDLSKGAMAGIAIGDPARPPDILFLHATGLNALTYRSLLEPLGERYHVVAVDMRGHGRTTLPATTLTYDSWRRHRSDVIELITKHFPAALTLAGHSMGGTVSALIAGARPDLVRGACLIEPVLLPPLIGAQFHVPGMPFAATMLSPLSRGARRRRAHFDSKRDAFNALKGRGFFKTWLDDALSDYVEDGFVDDPQGGVKLACARFYEARTFAAHRYDIWRALGRAPAPIAILGAATHSSIAPVALRRLERLRPDIRIAVVEGSTHALPMEKPDRTRAAIESVLLMAHGRDRFVDLD